MRPANFHVGGVLYWVIRTVNTSGVLVDADSTPTVAVRKNGSSVGDSVTITKRSATTGIYDCSYNPAGEVEGDSFIFEESAVISSATYTWSWAAEAIAIERGTDSANTTTPPTASAVASQVRTELTTELGRIDAAVSTRLASTSYTAPDNATIGTISTAVSAIATKLGGITLLKNWLALIMGKTADTSTRAEVNATTAGAGYNETTDSLEAVRDRGDAAWTGEGGGGGDATLDNQTEMLSRLAAIKNKTDLLTVQNSSIVQPDGWFVEITRGDSYDGVANAKISKTVTTNYTGWTGTFTIRHRVTDASLCSASVTVASSTLLEVTLTTTNTAFADLLSDDEFGPHPMDIQLVNGSSQATISGIATIYKDQTRA